MGFLFGSKSKRTSKATQSSTIRPLEPQGYQTLGNLLKSYYERALAKPYGLPAGFAEMGISGINETYAPIEQSIRNRLLARGLSASPIAGQADIATQLARGSEIARYRAQLPTLARDLYQQDLANAMRFYMARPMGQTSYGTSYQTDEISQQPGLFGGLVNMAAFLAGLGAFKPLSSLWGNQQQQAIGSLPPVIGWNP